MMMIVAAVAGVLRRWRISWRWISFCACTGGAGTLRTCVPFSTVSVSTLPAEITPGEPREREHGDEQAHERGC